MSRAALLALSITLLAACGQAGDLYLPEAPLPEAAAPPAGAEPAPEEDQD